MKLFTAFKSTAAIGVLALGFTTNSNAATPNTTSTTFTVSANVPTACSITANPLNFGNYSGAEADSSTTVNVTCTLSTPYNVGLDQGKTTGATVTSRQMTNGTNTLNYSLFSDNGHSKNWGQTVGTDTVTGSGTGAAQPIQVFGQIPASQNVVPGSYSDTITATVSY